MISFIDKHGISHERFVSDPEDIVLWYDDVVDVNQWFKGDEVVYWMDASLTSLRYLIEESVFVRNSAYDVFINGLPLFIEETGYIGLREQLAPLLSNKSAVLQAVKPSIVISMCRIFGGWEIA